MAKNRGKVVSMVSEPIDSVAGVEEEGPQDPVDDGIRGLAPDLEWRRSHQILNERVVILEKQVKDLASQTSQIPLILTQLQLLTQRMGKFQSNQESSQVVSPSKSNASGKPQLNLGRGSMEENLGSLQKNGECAPSVRSYGREKSMVQSSQSSVVGSTIGSSGHGEELPVQKNSNEQTLSRKTISINPVKPKGSGNAKKTRNVSFATPLFKETSILDKKLNKEKTMEKEAGIVCWLLFKDVGYSSKFFIFDPGGRSWCPKLRSLLCRSLELGLELKESLVPRGLINLGNLCFLNATLQALLSGSLFNEDEKYINSSRVVERYIAIWKEDVAYIVVALDGVKYQFQGLAILKFKLSVRSSFVSPRSKSPKTVRSQKRHTSLFDNRRTPILNFVCGLVHNEIHPEALTMISECFAHWGKLNEAIAFFTEMQISKEAQPISVVIEDGELVEEKRRPMVDYNDEVQTDVTANMRGVLVDWFVEVAASWGFCDVDCLEI